MSTSSTSDSLRLVREAEVRADIGLLGRLWSDSATFAVVPTNLALTEDWLRTSLALLPEDYRAGHFILMTSGSTGQPKLIVAKKSRAERLVEVIHAAQDDEPAQETIACLPLSYSYAFVNQWLWSHHIRRRLIQTDGFTRPDELKSALDAASEAMLCMVGVQVPLLRSLFGVHSFPGIIRLNFAGGRFPQEQLDNLRQIFPSAEVFNNYGCAEAMPRLTIRRANEADQAANIGRPLPGIELRTGDDDQLLFRSPFRAVAFIEGDAFRAIADDEWIETGDLGRAANHGMWVLLGRKSEVFKRFGEKISLPALQSAVQRVWHGELAFYRETDSMGENGHIMVLAPHPDKDQLKAIMMELRRDFARPHWPLRVESTDRLPRLPNNKVDAFALAARNNVTIQWSQRY
ncbi:MAG TPA: AMP-binding protein [Terriglobales bacterium]